METALAYITYLDRLIIDGVKWVVENNCWFYVIMCSIPFIGMALLASGLHGGNRQ